MTRQRGLSENDDNSGRITPEQWLLVQLERQKTSEPIPTILSRLGMPEEFIKEALERQFGRTFIDLRSCPIDKKSFKMIPEAFMREHKVAPVVMLTKTFVIAMVNPNNSIALDWLQSEFKHVHLRTGRLYPSRMG